MSDPADLITPQIAARLLEDAPPVCLELTLPEADLLVACLSASSTVSSALLAEKIRLQTLPQAQEICRRAALLQAPTESESSH